MMALTVNGYLASEAAGALRACCELINPSYWYTLLVWSYKCDCLNPSSVWSPSTENFPSSPYVVFLCSSSSLNTSVPFAPSASCLPLSRQCQHPHPHSPPILPHPPVSLFLSPSVCISAQLEWQSEMTACGIFACVRVRVCSLYCYKLA